MRLSARERRTLEAICDTFAPGHDGLPSASELGVPAAILEAVASSPRQSDRRQLRLLLALWEPFAGAVAARASRPFSSLSAGERERVLLRLSDGRLRRGRAAFQALRKGTLLHYYLLPGRDGGPNPAWRRLGYPGPLGPPEAASFRTLHPLAITGDTHLDCDVCVVGSGAGGGTAASVLAAAGLDVVVLEAGEYFDDGDFDGAELPSLRRLYLEAGASASDDQSVSLLAGSCLGGGTIVNYTTSFRTPDDVRDEWAALGVPAFASEEYTRSLDAVCERLGVNTDHSRPSKRDDVLRRGLEALGWHVGFMPRNVQGCDQGRVCGYCGYGCQLGAKQSTVKTWLADAERHGARIIVGAFAERVAVRAGEAAGVEARTAAGHRITVRARAVVAACGALHTPALLRRSGLGNLWIGRNLHLHPVTAVVGVFDEEIRPWEGTLQAVYSAEHRSLDGGYGVTYETTAAHPSLFVAFAPWRGARQHAGLVAELPRLGFAGILLRDRDGGQVRVTRDGQPLVRYALSGYDAGHLRAGVAAGAQIMEAAGARTIFSGHSRWVAYRPGRDGDRARFLRDADAAGWGAGQIVLYSFHLMSSARMGPSPATSACNPDGETWEAGNLYVCDGSVFPTASGVNPMVTIEAIAHLAASRLAERLGGRPASAEPG